MFKLSRYYSIASLIGISIILIVLSVFFRHFALQSLMEHQATANENLTKSFANATWNRFADFVAHSSQYSAQELKLRPEIQDLRERTLALMKNMNVVKVKIYNLQGITVFSTDANQIGVNRSTNLGFLSAKSGKIASEIGFRNEFYAFEQIILDRNLVTSYIPIRRQHTGPVEAVFELYSDVTPLTKEMDATQNKIIFSVFCSLAILYLFLFVIVKRADHILGKQELIRKENENKIRYQAYHDSLTGLPNRDNFIEHMQESILRAKRHNKAGALMYLDLDRFKLVNDTLGHDCGDMLLKITANRLKKTLRESDFAFRISGDEFTVILEDLDIPEAAAGVAKRILDAMNAPISLNGYEVIVNVSIGITHFPNKDNNIDGLVREADAAMYRAKEIGNNRYEFFTQEMNVVAFERLTMETDLKRALKNQEFELYYQSKVDTSTNQLIGIEALLRWNHPVKGIVPPSEFIPVLEDSGYINNVGEWVLHTACSQAKAWQDQGYTPVRISVNISAKQFRSQHLLATVEEALERSGLESKYLELELTESMFIENIDQAIKTMRELKALGVALSIDDFGSGYSSLSYLKQFPIDYLKIDRSFIRDLINSPKDAAITAAISTLAQSLNLGIIAEGVEEISQLEFLKSNGCHEVQGYLFNHPIPADQFENVMLKNTKNSDVA